MLTVVTALPWEAGRFQARLRGRRRAETGDGWAVWGERGPVQLRLLVSGPGMDRARRAAAALATLEPPVSGILATGVAAGLVDGLRPGEIVLAERLRLARSAGGHAGSTIAPDPAFRAFTQAALERAGLRYRGGVNLTVGEALRSPAAKREQARATEARAAQMEDYVWAEAAAAQGVPFVSARAILDPVGASLPGAVLGWDWRAARGGEVARSLLRRPTLAPTLVRLAWHRRAAVAAIDRMLEAVVSWPQSE